LATLVSEASNGRNMFTIFSNIIPWWIVIAHHKNLSLTKIKINLNNLFFWMNHFYGFHLFFATPTPSSLQLFHTTCVKCPVPLLLGSA
jgi:hypothetical protein